LDRYGGVLGSLLRAKPRMATGKDGQPRQNELDPRPLGLSPDARTAWIEFANNVEVAMGSGGQLEAVRAFANKLPEQAARIAAVLALVDDAGAGEVTVEQMNRALHIVFHYGQEALRLVRAGVVDPNVRLAQRLLDWLWQSWSGNLISLPDIYQRSLHAISAKTTAERVVASLEDHGWVARVEGGAEIAGARRRDGGAIVGKGGATVAQDNRAA
jgi:hypothetical protein